MVVSRKIPCEEAISRPLMFISILPWSEKLTPYMFLWFFDSLAIALSSVLAVHRLHVISGASVLKRCVTVASLRAVE